ncbi:MAG: putative PEP-binding protein [Thiobacillaceae bacterium]
MLPIQALPFVPGHARGRVCIGADGANAQSIVVLTQAELTRLKVRPVGVILVGGALYAHPTLRLLSQGIPTVLLAAEAASTLPPGLELSLDGQTGRLSPEPEGEVALPPAAPALGQPVLTRDGVAIELRCSITDARGAAAARAAGAAAIGLARSEYLYPADGRQPDRVFLTEACAAVCEAAAPLSVTFRLIDIAGDKRPPWLPDVPGLGGTLGLQGARLYAVESVRSVYLAQLDALAALADRYPLRVLLPYLVSVGEFERLQAEIRQHLPDFVPLGSMLETPAAALAVREFLEQADFAALGMNDLMQCLFAADRYRPELCAYLDPYSPVIYRFLRLVATQAGAGIARVQVSGLLAQLPGVLPVLIGLGYRAFSVDPVMLPWLAQRVRQTETHAAAALADALCSARCPAEVKRLLGLSTAEIPC